MGEALSTLNLWEKDPKYNKVKDKLRKMDSETRKLVDEFLIEQDKVQTERDRLLKQLEKFTEHNNSLNEKNRKLQTENQNLNSELKQAINKKAQLEMSKTTSYTTNQVVVDLLDEQKKLNTDTERQKTEIQTLQKECKMLKEDNQKLRSDNKILSSEKESALSRLSKIAGIQLTKGNSDIADLSDVNRPTSLAEKYGSLYTEEWMEAYDEITMGKTIKKENNECEKELFNIVESCYAICKNLERKQMTDIKVHAWDIACSLHQQPDQLVSAATTTKYYVMNGTHIEEKDRKAATMTTHQPAKLNVKSATMAPKQQPNAVFDIKVLAIQKCMEELIQIVHERRKYDKHLLEYVQQKTFKKFEQYNKPGSNSRVIKYVRKCTELCWSMVIKNPPMVLVCGQLEGKPFDNNMFNAYTKKGPVVDFVVWPALMLHIEGPVLQKGVVQGKEEKTDKADTQGSQESGKQGRVEGLHAAFIGTDVTTDNKPGSSKTPDAKIEKSLVASVKRILIETEGSKSIHKDTLNNEPGSSSTSDKVIDKNMTKSQNGKSNLAEMQNDRIGVMETGAEKSTKADLQIGNTDKANSENGNRNTTGTLSKNRTEQ